MYLTKIMSPIKYPSGTWGFPRADLGLLQRGKVGGICTSTVTQCTLQPYTPVCTLLLTVHTLIYTNAHTLVQKPFYLHNVSSRSSSISPMFTALPA
jgi:hypothetical protein